MKSIITLICISFLILLEGCSSVAVNYDYDSKFDFTHLKKYSWLPMPKDLQADELIVKRIQSAIDRNLQDKGFVQTSNESDFVIALYISTHIKKELWESGGYGYRGYGRYGSHWSGNRIEIYEYEEGTVIVEIINASNKDLIWRGTGVGMVEHDLSPKARDKRIGQVVAELLENFPPVIKE